MGVAKRPSNTPKTENMHKAAQSLRQIIELTTGCRTTHPPTPGYVTAWSWLPTYSTQ